MGGACGTYGREEKSMHERGKPEGKRPLEGHGRRRENNDTIRIKERVWKNVNWIALAQDKDKWRVVVNTVMNLRVS
jgi:hypothetical protein